MDDPLWVFVGGSVNAVRSENKRKVSDVVDILEYFRHPGAVHANVQVYLEDEGLPSNEERIEFVLPVIKNLDGKKLTSIRLKVGADFKRQGRKPTLDEPNSFLLKHPVTLNWYPKIQTRQSKGVSATTDNAEVEVGDFGDKHLAFMDVNAIYFESQHFKNERAWHNLNLPRESIMKLLLSAESTPIQLVVGRYRSLRSPSASALSRIWARFTFSDVPLSRLTTSWHTPRSSSESRTIYFLFTRHLLVPRSVPELAGAANPKI
jgi:hypothetical protein